MRTVFRYASPALVLVGQIACAESARDPVSSPAPDGPRTTTSTTSAVWTLADLDTAFGVGMWSLDSTQAGNNAHLYISPTVAGSEPPEICRDHLQPSVLWWDGGWGLAQFNLEPPLLFVGYRSGAVRSGVLGFRRAIFESIKPSEATDPAGNVWRFQGRFNALCRAGLYEAGPIVFRAQGLRPQDPIDHPILVRRGSVACTGAGGDMPVDQGEYDPYDAGWSIQPADGSGGSGGDDCGGGGDGGGTQYEPGDNTGGETVDWETGTGAGGRSVCGDNAVVEYICIDEWVEGTGWVEWGCGYVTTC